MKKLTSYSETVMLAILSSNIAKNTFQEGKFDLN